MKLQTKIIAWILAAVAFLLLFITTAVPYDTSSNEGFVAMILAPFLIGWAALLLSQKWAWWWLLISHCLGSVWAIAALAVWITEKDMHYWPGIKVFLTSTSLAMVFVILPIIVLLTDRPSQWKSENVESTSGVI